jgi:hypothetical protein
MSNQRSQSALSFCRAQVTLFFLSIMASLIVLAFIVIVVGKTAKDKTYADNAADSGALAACSIMAQGFNDNSADNGDDQDGKREYEAREVEEQRLANQRANMKNNADNELDMDIQLANAAVPPGTRHMHDMAAHEGLASKHNLGSPEEPTEGSTYQMNRDWQENTIANDERQRRNLYGGMLS